MKQQPNQNSPTTHQLWNAARDLSDFCQLYFFGSKISCFIRATLNVLNTYYLQFSKFQICRTYVVEAIFIYFSKNCDDVASTKS